MCLCMLMTQHCTRKLPQQVKSLQSVSEWVARNELVLNISKTKSIVFGTNHSLHPNYVEIEQVEETKLLGVTLNSKLLWSKHTDAKVAKMWRGLSVIKCCYSMPS